MITPTNFGLLSDVYQTLPAGSGLQVGAIQQAPNSPDLYILVQNGSGGNILNNYACKWKDETGGQYIVDKTGATTDVAVGCNDAANASIPDQYFFWMHYKGMWNVLQAVGTLMYAILAPSATAGVLATTGGDNQGNISCAKDQVGGAPSATPAWVA